MNRWLPFPVLSGLLFGAWLALSGTLAIAHVLLAAGLAIVIPLATSGFLDHLPRLASPAAAIRLTLRVLLDIVLANVTVARLVLGPVERLRPAFVELPLALSHPQSIALLASIITMTPGTVSVDVAPDRSALLIHALDCADSDALIADIKRSYEQPLLEIFGC